MVYGFTGHRPPRLGGYGKEARQKLYNFAHRTIFMTLNGEDSAVIGMAQGWDLAVAQACFAMSIPYTAAIPFPGQEEVWPDEEVRNLYKILVEGASKKVYIHNERVSYARMGEVSKILQLRNQYIVDHSDKMIALYDGDLDGDSPRIVTGGTFKCIVYAKIKKKEIINVWDEWEAFQK